MISRYRSVRWYWKALFALAAAAACGGFAVLGVVREYNMRDEESRMEANFKLSYRKDSAFRLGNRVTDLLIGSYVTQQVIASQDHRAAKGAAEAGAFPSAAAAPPTGPPAEEATEAEAENFKSRKERNRDMTIMVMDGQGGRMGKSVVEQIRRRFPEDEILASAPTASPLLPC